MSPGLHVESRGSGPALVLWHGWGMNLRCFDALCGALAAHHRLIAVDLPGHGRSPWSPQWAAEDWLPALLASVPADSTLLGWSLGGQFALRAAAVCERVARLVLVCTTPRFVRAADWPAGLEAGVVQQFHRRLATDANQVVRDFLELELRGDADAAAHRTALHAALHAHGTACEPALHTGLTLLESQDLRVLAGGVEQPTLIVSGQYDRITPAAAAAALARMMPRARHIDIPRSGHAPLLSADERWLQPLRDFMAQPAGRVA